MRNNLHLTLTPFRSESRLLKESSSLLRARLVQKVFVVALHEDGLAEREDSDPARSVWRVRLRLRRLPSNLVFHLVKYLELWIRVIWFCRNRQVDLVNVHHLELLPLGVCLKWIYGASLVFDAHELETERNGLAGARKWVLKRVERALIGYADLLVVVSGSIEAWYREHYSYSRIVTVLNCPEFRQPQRTRRLHEALNIPDDRVIVLYQGTLARGRGVDLLLKVFSTIDDCRHVLVLMGDGELESDVRAAATAHANIFWLDSVPPSDVLEYTASADVGVSFIENTNLSYQWCLPNKLFEYIMAGVPVIVSDLPEMRRVVEGHRIGAVIPELTVGRVTVALADIEQTGSTQLAERLRVAASQYCWQTQETKMFAAYAQWLVADRRGRNRQNQP